MPSKAFPYDICIIGGAGHIGLPLALSLANTGLRILIYDLNSESVKAIRQKEMPFLEHDAQPVLDRVLEKTLFLSQDPQDISLAKNLIFATGTPVDEFLTPNLNALPDLITGLMPFIDPEQIIIVRSTVYPGTCRQIKRVLESGGGVWNIAYCPERIAQGHAMRELNTLPQIVSGLTILAEQAAAGIFSKIAPKIISLSVEAAELTKLFSNAWRYVQFAAANQFYMMAESHGADYNEIRAAMMDGYDRAANLPGAGFAAGPCLLKDTMQLEAYFNNNFHLGRAAMLVNEGMPGFIIEALRRKYELSRTRVGILGMAFKGDSDDIRDSLAYKLRKQLRFHGAAVKCSDEYVSEKGFVSKEELIAWVDVVIVGAPHSAYKNLNISDHIDVIDLWEITNKRA